MNKLFEIIFGIVLALGIITIGAVLFWLDRMRWCF